MEQEKNNKGVVALLIVIIIILLALVVLLATGTISFKSMPNGDKQDENNLIETEPTVENYAKINDITFDKPVAGGYGGDTVWTLMGNVTADFTCIADKTMAITIEGYCLDNNDNKYIFRAPEGSTMFYCSESNEGKMQATKLIKSDGNTVNIMPSETLDVNWDEIEITYCKFDKANVILSDYSKLDTQLDINFEKEFK